MNSLEKILALEQRFVWDRDYRHSKPWVRIPMSVLRTVLYIYHEFSNGELNLRAMSLVYTTILSLVPLLAFSFSVLKGFGVQNQVEPVLLEYFAALGPEKSVEITGRVVEFVNNIDVRVLGAVGLGLLVYTIITLMQKIEAAFNHAWHVRAHRRFAERFTTFISVLTVGPLLVFAAIAITGSVMHNAVMDSITTYEPFGMIAAQVTRLAPYLLVIGAFTFLYILIPNTHVRFPAALAGGIAAGLLWETAGYVFAYFVSTATKYQAVYATFGTAMFFMIWMYVSWLILLVGASVSYYAQHPRIVIARARRWRFSFESFEEVALAVLAQIVGHYYDHAPVLDAEALSEARQVPPELIDKVLTALVDTQVLNMTADIPPAYVLAVPPEETRVVDVLLALRRYQPAGSRRVLPSGDTIMTSLREKIDESFGHVFGDTTLKELARAASEASDEAGADKAGPVSLLDRA